MTDKVNPLKQKNIDLCKQLLMLGRGIPFAKHISGITKAEMKRQGFIHELIIPDPTPGREGMMIHTGRMLVSLRVEPKEDQWISNKRMKANDRKAHFAALRKERKERWRSVCQAA